MRIAVISTLDIRGGASKAAYNVHQSLIRKGESSRMYVQRKYSHDDSVIGPEGIISRTNRYIYPALDSIPRYLFYRNEHILHSPAIFGSCDIEKINRFKPDIVNVHWVWGGFVTLTQLSKIKAPIVWTLHDMWPFMSFEHYLRKENDSRYIYGYKNEGNIKTRIEYLRWASKKNSFNFFERLYFISPSKWLQICAQNSFLLRKYHTELIPNGLDTALYLPLRKKIAREKLNLPLDKKIILFGGTNANQDPRKGYDKLCESLRMLKKTPNADNIHLVIFGSAKDDGVIKEIGFSCSFLGIIPDEMLPVVYPASDLFIAPSLQDNLPCTIMESLACGTPVVAFDVGGIPDMVHHKKTGYLADVGESKQLFDGIQWLLSDDARLKKISCECRNKVMHEYSLDILASNTIQFFNKILNDNREHRNNI